MAAAKVPYSEATLTAIITITLKNHQQNQRYKFQSRCRIDHQHIECNFYLLDSSIAVMFCSASHTLLGWAER